MTRRHHVRELGRYALVGGFNAATYFGLYTAGVLAGIPYLAALVTSFLLSVTLGYWLHEHWTFKGASPTVAGLGKWMAAQGASVAVNLVLLAIAVDVLGAGPIIAQLALMPIMPAATYLVGRRWVFTRATPQIKVPG